MTTADPAPYDTPSLMEIIGSSSPARARIFGKFRARMKQKHPELFTTDDEIEEAEDVQLAFNAEQEETT